MEGFRYAAVATLLMAAAGCRNLAPPDFDRPGTAPAQQSRAHQFDPYPETEVGPAVVGSRPPSYDKPPPEVMRPRWVPWAAGR